MTLHNSLRTDMVMLAKAGSWCMNSSSCSVWRTLKREKRKKFSGKDGKACEIHSKTIQTTEVAESVLNMFPASKTTAVIGMDLF